MPAISTKKPVSSPRFKKGSPLLSAASLSRKKKWTPGLKPCSGVDADSLDPSSSRRFGEYQELSSNVLPAFRGADGPDHLPAHPFPENTANRGRLGHRSGTRELPLTPLPYAVVYVVRGEVIEVLHIGLGATWVVLTGKAGETACRTQGRSVFSFPVFRR